MSHNLGSTEVPAPRDVPEGDPSDRMLQQMRDLRELFDNSPDGIVLCDSKGSLLMVNERLEQLLGYSHGSLVDRPVETLIPMRRREAHERLRRNYAEEPKRRPMAPALQLTALHADGSEIPVEIALAPVHIDGVEVTMATVRDARERLEHQRRLREAEEVLLLADERERIARDLHDVVVQRLFATGLGIQSVAMRVPDDSRERLDKAVDAIDEAIRDIRSSIFRLSNAGSGRAGTRSAIADLAAEAERLLGFQPRVQFDGPVDTQVDGALAGEVLGVLRELVSNAVRHAKCTDLVVHVTVDDHAVMCSVRDNGAGVADRGGAVAGRGLKNLAERAQRLQGSFELRPLPEGGTEARWSARLS